MINQERLPCRPLTGGTMDTRYKDEIAHEFELCITNTIARLENSDTNRPFHSALLSEPVLFWSRFERSFSTSFGQRAIERISKLVALAGGAEASENQKETYVGLSRRQLAAVEAHISLIRRGGLGRPPSWELDLATVLRQISERGEDQRVISDLWWFKDGRSHYMSIKTVKPNIDQTAEAKRDLLKLQSHDESARVFFGLYYNPYGESRLDYAWNPPMRVFDFRHDPVVLIGCDYWDTLGGPGTYNQVLKIAQEVGVRTRKKIDSIR